MERITAKEAAEKWNITVRRVQDLCKRGLIPGAERFGLNWMIPADALKPQDRRKRADHETMPHPPENRPLLRRSPFLDMTDLYSEPGTADKCIEELAYHPEAQALFASEIAYSRGQIEDVYRQARHLLSSHSGLFAVISGGMLLSLIAMWKGDIQLWNEARRYLYEAPCKSDAERDVVFLAIASADSAIRNTKDFPEWFCRGCFYHLPKDALPAANVYYVKHLLISAQELALGNTEFDGVYGFGLMKTIPYIVEPMIARMMADKIIMAEIYLRLLAAVAYHQCGDDANAAIHLDQAIRLCLADGLYGPLVEHRRQLGSFLDDRLSLINPEALRKVKELHKQLHAGWTKIHNAVLDRTVQVSLTSREREVARLACFSLTDVQIAARLHLSLTTVKSTLKNAKNKTGVDDRHELAIFI